MTAFSAALGKGYRSAYYGNLSPRSKYPGQNGSCSSQVAFLLFYPLYAASRGIVPQALTGGPVLSKLNKKDFLWNECDGA